MHYYFLLFALLSALIPEATAKDKVIAEETWKEIVDSARDLCACTNKSRFGDSDVCLNRDKLLDMGNPWFEKIENLCKNIKNEDSKSKDPISYVDTGSTETNVTTTTESVKNGENGTTSTTEKVKNGENGTTSTTESTRNGGNITTTTEKIKNGENGTTSTTESTKNGGSITTTTEKVKNGENGTTSTTESTKNGGNVTTTTEKAKNGGNLTTTTERAKNGGNVTTTTEKAKNGGNLTTTTERAKNGGNLTTTTERAKNETIVSNKNKNKESTENREKVGNPDRLKNENDPSKQSAKSYSLTTLLAILFCSFGAGILFAVGSKIAYDRYRKRSYVLPPEQGMQM